MTLNDVFQRTKTFREWLDLQLTAFTPGRILVALALALACGALIALVYKKTYRGVLYSPSFSLTLILLCTVTTPVVMAIGDSVVLSMGMVGALSIVRFRTAVKDPLDTAYMFWAITVGILLGSELYILALISMLCIAVIIVAISLLRLRQSNGYLLVLHYDEHAMNDIEATLRRNARFWRVRSKTVTRSGAEMTVEVRLDQRVNLVTDMLDINGVFDATLVACQTEAGA